MQGMVKWFSIKKGFGFIESEGKDYFVHRWDIEAKSKLKKGDRVSFEPGGDPSLNFIIKGIKAMKVRKID